MANPSDDTTKYRGKPVVTCDWLTTQQMQRRFPKLYSPPSPLDICTLQVGDLVNIGNDDSIAWMRIEAIGGWTRQFICIPINDYMGPSMQHVTMDQYYMIHNKQILRFKRKTASDTVHNLRQYLENRVHEDTDVDEYDEDVEEDDTGCSEESLDPEDRDD